MKLTNEELAEKFVKSICFSTGFRATKNRLWFLYSLPTKVEGTYVSLEFEIESYTGMAWTLVANYLRALMFNEPPTRILREKSERV